MRDLAITHTHEEGTRLRGSVKGDGVWEILRPLGWQFTRYSGIHLRGTRDDFSDHRIESARVALVAAGHEVDVDIDDTWRPASVRYAERGERVDNRAERLDGYAANAANRSAAARAGRERIGDGIPMGQPILRGHHSQRSSERAHERMTQLGRREFAEADKARELADKAAGAIANEEHRQNPRVMTRRVETLLEGIRRYERELAKARIAETSDRYQVRLRNLIARDTEEVEYLRQLLAELADTGAYVAWTRNDFVKGDEVRVLGTWLPVRRVNAKSVSVPGGYGMAGSAATWSETVTWDKIQGRRSLITGMQQDSPDGEPWPIRDATRVARWATLSARPDRNTPEGRMVAVAARLVHGLPSHASAAEVDAFAPDRSDVATRRALAIAAVGIYDRLTTGEAAEDIAETITPIGTPTWRLPDTEPIRVRVVDLAVGDLVRGVLDNGIGGSIIRAWGGPVQHIAPVQHRRESGDFITVLVNGEQHTLKTHVWLAVHRPE